MELAVLVLAAGKGTRMKSSTPKVLHQLAEREMVLHVLDAVHPLNPARTVVITGHGADDVESVLHKAYPATTCVRQTEQLGTGHAVQQAEEALKGFSGTVLILYGDVPLIETSAIEAFVAEHTESGNAITLASAVVNDPTGLGRILRAEDGALQGIREHKDCTEEEHEIDEINVGFYAVDAQHLFRLLADVKNDNAQEEYYLPDIISLGLNEGLQIEAEYFQQAPEELGGINNRLQLAEAETVMQDKLRTHHMLNGATLIDPATTYFAWDTEIGQDVTIYPNTYIGAGVKIADNCSIGPFARLRNGSDIQAHAKIGNFVETKAVTVGEGSKINHFTYAGNATIGKNVNVGAGTIFANYHHFRKEKCNSVIEDGASLGANSVIVAPVTVGKNTFVGAGTVVRKSTEAGCLVVDKPEYIIKKDYK